MYQNRRNVTKILLREKLISLNIYVRKPEGSHIHNFTLYLKKLEKEEQIKAQVSIRKELIKIKSEINKITKRK